MITVELADPADDAAVAEAAGLLTMFWMEVLGPVDPPVPPAEVADGLRNPPANAEELLWLARDGDEAVGLAVLHVRSGRGNDDRAWVIDLWVRPDRRRRGIGRQLLDVVVKAARDRGRTILDGAHPHPHEAGAAFAAAVGATSELADDQNRVATADLDRTLLEAWARSAPAGYSIVAWDGPCPDDLVEAFARLMDVMNTAPMPDSMNPEIMSVDTVRDGERRILARGGELWRAAARHDATGELAGYTEMMFAPFKPWLASQGDTGVAVAHRGHGIGRWLKGTMALRVLDEKPEVGAIETWNASSNAHMLAINHAMGFRRTSQWQEVELSI